MKTVATKCRLASIIGPIAVGALSLLGTNAHAAVVFQDNFDGGSPYSDGGNLPTGFGVVSNGEWATSIQDTGGSVTTPTSPNLSAPRSLFLQGGIAQAVFGPDSTHTATTTGAIDCSFAFNTSNQATTLAQVFDSTGSFGTALADVGVDWVANSTFAAYFSGQGWVTMGSALAPNQWYYADILMPANPSPTNNQYTVELFDSTHSTLIGSATGQFTNAATVGDGYTSIGFTEPYAASQGDAFSINLDNVLVTTVPEPGTVSLALLGVLGGFFGSAFRNGKKRMGR